MPIKGLALVLVAALVGVVHLAATAQAAELIYVHEPGCPYCRKWEREIAPKYPMSEAGKAAPLRSVHIRELPDAGLSLARAVRYTPTFILVEGRSEIGRIEGYPGEDFFWGLLDRLIEKLDPPAPAKNTPVPATRINLMPRPSHSEPR